MKLMTRFSAFGTPIKARQVGLAIVVAVGVSWPSWIDAAGVAHDAFLQRVYGVGHETVGIAAGDFDNDGRLDLVTASYVAPYLAVLFGNDSGTFDPEVRVPGSTSTTWDILVADLDGDGADDIATRSFYSVNVWLGNGDGTFAQPTSYSCYSDPPIANSLAVADFNSDGKPDIVAAGGRHTVLLSTGDGAFDVMFLPHGGSYYVLTGDFNGDGLADFADGNRVWIREGGPFSPAFTPVASGVGGADGVAFDFDGDGRLDIAIGDGSNVIVHLGRGNGSFDPAVSYPVPIPARELILAYLNGDNAPDLVTSSTHTFPGSRDPPVVLLSNGDGTFGDATSYFAPLLGGRMVSGDFSGDGRVDVAFAPYRGLAVMPPDKAGNEALSLVYVMEGDGQGGLVSEIVERYDVGRGISPRAPGSIVAADFNGDGHLDLATANSESDDVSLLLGNPDGSFTELGSLPVGGVPISLALGFFDPGVIPDLAVARQGAQDLLILLGNGDATFTPASVAAVGSAPAAVVQADLNGDGVQDLATANTGSNDISVFLGVGDGTFSIPASFSAGAGPTALAVVHLNASGGPDLAVVNAGSSHLSILPGNGDGTFGTAVLYPSSSVLQPAIKVADVNGDGRQDVVVVAHFEPHIQIFPGDGASGLSTPLEVNFGTGVVDVAIVDLDGDGRLDLATTHRWGVSLMGVSFGTEDGFETRAEFATEAYGRFATGDFDGNGWPDLAVVGGFNPAVAVHLNQLPVFLEFASNTSTLTWPRLLGTDSYNIYRGNLADLYDQDADGLPDAGYGSCRNDLDPDTSDTVFVDDEIPFPGEGYFYLMARVGPQGETDLGSTSSAQPRVPSLACP